MRTNYVLIDFENVQVKSLALLNGDQFRVKVFLGPKNTKLPVGLVLAIQNLGDRADYIVLETPSANALDFHITYYLGVLSKADPTGFFHIISKDTGFDSLIKHLKAHKIFCMRSTSIEQMPCFIAPPLPVATTTSAPVEAPPKKTATQSLLDDLVLIAVADLIKRKTSKPRTTKTLLSTIHAKCGKDMSARDIDLVMAALVKRGYVKVSGTKVTYVLPAE